MAQDEKSNRVVVVWALGVGTVIVAQCIPSHRHVLFFVMSSSRIAVGNVVLFISERMYYYEQVSPSSTFLSAIFCV